MKLLKRNKKGKDKKIIPKADKPTQKKVKKAPLTQTKLKKKKDKDTEVTLSLLKEVVKQLNADIPPNRMSFFLEFMRNGGNLGKAYKTTHPNVTIESARVIGSRWIKGITLSDLLSIFDLGYGRIIKALKSPRLSERDRLHFLMIFHKLAHIEVEQTGNLNVNVYGPSRTSGPSEPKVHIVESQKIESPSKKTTIKEKEEKDAKTKTTTISSTASKKKIKGN